MSAEAEQPGMHSAVGIERCGGRVAASRSLWAVGGQKSGVAGITGKKR